MRPIEEPRCKRCGKPVSGEETEFCYDCRNQKLYYEQGKSLWIHDKLVKKSIYGFKYKNRRVYAQTYGRELIKKFGSLLRIWEIELMIPVPLHKKRYRKRGYNQAFLLAQVISDYTGIPIDDKLVIRKKDTDPQKQFGNKERKANLKNAFELSRKQIQQKHILLIDDIYTTGSTINEIARILKKTGVEKIFFLTISIGQGF